MYDLPFDNDTLKRDGILTYDIETSRDTTLTDQINPEQKLRYLGKQTPMSWAASYKLPTGEVGKKYALIQTTPEDLVQRLVDLMVETSLKNLHYYQKAYPELWEKINFKGSKNMVRFIAATALPCIGFNSAKFDIKTMTYFGFLQKLMNHSEWEAIGGKILIDPTENMLYIPNKIIQVCSVRLIDQLLWTPCSLDQFINGFHSNPNNIIGKLAFPHSTFNLKRDINKPFTKQEFPREFFWNDLKQQELPLDMYNYIFQVAKKEKVKTMRQYLELYNLCDVIPFREACENFRDQVRQISTSDVGQYIEPYNETMGMPTLACKMMKLMSYKPWLEEFDNEWNFPAKPMKEKHATINVSKTDYRSLLSSYKKQDKTANERIFNKTKHRKTSFSHQWIKDTLLNQHERCYCCREKMDDTKEGQYTLDRIDNFKGHTEDNMVISCVTCNKARKNAGLSYYTKIQKDFSFRFKYKNVLPCVNSVNEKEIFNLLREKGIVGGPSIVFHGHHKCASFDKAGSMIEEGTHIQHTINNPDEGEKYIVGPKGNMVCNIESLDANSLYPWAYMGDMPCGKGKIVNGDTATLKDKIMKDELFGFVECSLRVSSLRKYQDKYLACPPFYATKEIDVVRSDGKVVKERKLASFMRCENVVVATTLFKWYMS